MRGAVRRNGRECAGAFAHYVGIRRMNRSKAPGGVQFRRSQLRTCPTKTTRLDLFVVAHLVGRGRARPWRPNAYAPTNSQDYGLPPETSIELLALKRGSAVHTRRRFARPGLVQASTVHEPHQPDAAFHLELFVDVV